MTISGEKDGGGKFEGERLSRWILYIIGMLKG